MAVPDAELGVDAVVAVDVTAVVAFGASGHISDEVALSTLGTELTM